MVRLSVAREPVPVMVADLDGNIEFMSPALCRWTGTESSRFGDVGLLFAQMVPDPAEQERWTAWWHQWGLAKAAIGLDPDPFAVRLTTAEGPRFVVVHTTICDSRAILTFIDETESWHAARLLEVQRDLGTQLLRCSNLAECLVALLDSVICLPGLECGVVCLFDEDPDVLRTIDCRGMPDDFATSGNWMLADSWTVRHVKSNRPLYIAVSEVPGELGELFSAWNLKHMGLLPLTDEQTVIGCLIVFTQRFERIGEPSRIGVESLVFRCGEAMGLIHARDARKTAERQFRLAVDSAGLGIWMADLKTGFVQSCPRTRMLHGHADAAHSDAETAILAVHPDDRDALIAGVRHAMVNGKVFSGEYRTLNGGDDCRWIAIHAHAFDEAGGKWLYGVVRDITDSKQSEAALIEARDHLEMRVAERTSELAAAKEAAQKESELLQVALNASQSGAWSWEIGQQEIGCDVRIRHLFGYKMDEPVTFDLWLSRVHPEDRQVMLDNLTEVIESHGDPEWDHEFRINHPELGERWLASLGRAQLDSDGQAVRFVGINFDVTKRRTSENELRESEEKYRSLFESMVDGFIRLDMDGRIIETNRALQEMLGFSDEELSGMTHDDITPPKWREMEHRVLDTQVLIRGHSAPYQKEIQRKNGTHIHVELRVFMVRDALGNPASTWAIIQDISRRREVERLIKDWNQRLENEVAVRTRELTQSESRLRQLAESTFEGIAISEGGILTDVNPQLAGMHGFQSSEMIGRPYSDFVAAGLQELNESKLIVQGTIGDTVLTCEFVGLRSDGSTFTAEARICSRSNQGRSILLKAVRDVTASRQAAARLLTLKNELEQAQRLALVGEVSAGIVHQIGQPLSGMGVNLQVLRNRASSCNRTCDLIDILEDLDADVARQRDAVNSLRALANPGSPRRHPTDLNDLVAGVMKLLCREIDELGIRLDLDYGSGLPHVELDSAQVSQVILNLVRNAIEACAERPPERRELQIRTHREEENRIAFSIRDSGPGIHPTVLNALFAPFVTTKQGGIGMGLRLSRTIVHAHRGIIVGENNTDGPGAMFRVSFPV